MGHRLQWLLAAVLIACPGCFKGGGTQEKAGEKRVSTAGKTTTEAVVEARDKALKTLRVDLDSLEKEVKKAIDGAGDRAEEVRKSLDPKLQRAKDELKKAGEAVEEAWEKTRAAVEKAVGDVRDALPGNKPAPKS